MSLKPVWDIMWALIWKENKRKKQILPSYKNSNRAPSCQEPEFWQSRMAGWSDQTDPADTPVGWMRIIQRAYWNHMSWGLVSHYGICHWQLSTWLWARKTAMTRIYTSKPANENTSWKGVIEADIFILSEGMECEPAYWTLLFGAPLTQQLAF